MITASEVKKELGDYTRLMNRAKRLTTEIRLFPEDRVLLEPLLKTVTERTASISKMINKLRDTEKKEILYRKYIKGETLEQIGEEMGISSRHVQRLINRAIETLVGGRQ